MKLLNFTIIKLTCCLIIGILLGVYYSVGYSIALIAIAIGLLSWFVTFLMTDKKVKQSVLLGIVTYVLMIIVGVLIITFHTHNNHKKHYTNMVELGSPQNMKIHVYKTLKQTKFYKKYLGEVIAVNSNKSTGIILINSDSTQTIDIDDVLYATIKLTDIQTSLNPHQFDYRAYMQRQQVYNQLFLDSKNSIVLKKKPSVYGKAQTVRKQINTTLVEHSVSEQNLSVINALLLGQRQEVSKATYKSFTTSGAVHILAISGLHIGLLLVLLNMVFKPVTYLKHGKLLASICIILLLWLYAFLVGLSPSVVRAVTMFSLFTVAIYSNRITNTYNTLVLSAFILLICDPYYLFDIGFQMSYAAVFAIIWIKPLFDRWWQPKNIITKRLWDVFSVTIAAQLGVLPLSLFYFHQFPGLFFISNMVIIPILGVLLGLGIVTLMFAYYGWVPGVLFHLFNECVSWLIKFVTFIATQEQFIFEQISFNTWNMITVYIMIVCGVLLWYSFSCKRVVFMLMSIVSVQLVFLSNKWVAQSDEFIVFNQYKATCIGVKYGQNFKYDSRNLNYMRHVETYMVNEFVKKSVQDSLKNVYVFNEQTILVIDEKAVYNTSFQPEVILLTASPKLNLERLISVLQPKQVVVDNTNYKSYVEKWKQTCMSHNVPFYVTNTQGAYVLK